MGKIRVKTLGDEELEQQQAKEDKKRKEQKKTVKAPGMKGGERIASVGPTEEELEAVGEKLEEEKTETEEKKEKKIIQRNKKASPHSQNYNSLSNLIDKTKSYSIKEGLEILNKLQRGKFDETVEIHINTTNPGISGNVTLPNGTGKKTRVAIATDELISEIEKGVINFDILVAVPSQMAKLAKVAKVLGPRGLMPNPKNGTITEKPEDMVKKYEGGQINFKTESKNPLLHLTVGKMSFGESKLLENIEVMISAVKKSNIVNATLKSTMSPAIKIKV